MPITLTNQITLGSAGKGRITGLSSSVGVAYSLVYGSETNSRAKMTCSRLFHVLRHIHPEEAPCGINWAPCIWAIL